MVLVHHAEFQRRGGAQDFLGAGGVLHARQLHHDALLSLLLDHRLRHAELVDPVPEGGDVLLQGEVAHLPGRLLADGKRQRRRAVGVPLLHLEVGELSPDEIAALVPIGDFAESHHDAPLRAPGDGLVSNPFLSEQRADVAGVALLGLAQRAGHVHLHEEVDPAAKVQAEIHGQRPQGLEPLGRCRRQVQRDHVLSTQLVPELVLSFELLFRIVESNQQRTVAPLDLFRLEVRRNQSLSDPILQPRVGLGPARRRNLYRRVLAENVRQGKHDADGEHHRDEQVLPKGVSVDHELDARPLTPEIHGSVGSAAVNWTSWCPWASARRRPCAAPAPAGRRRPRG